MTLIQSIPQRLSSHAVHYSLPSSPAKYPRLLHHAVLETIWHGLFLPCFLPKAPEESAADACRGGNLEFTSRLRGEGFSVLQLTWAQVKTYFSSLHVLDPLTAHTLPHFSPLFLIPAAQSKTSLIYGWLHNIKTRNSGPSHLEDAAFSKCLQAAWQGVQRGEGKQSLI